MLRCGVIGLGKQAQEDHIPAILESDQFDLVAVYDTNSDLVKEIADFYKLDGLTSLEDMIKMNIDVAVIAVPHSEYIPIIYALAEAGVHIIKEKPLATTIQEAMHIHQLINDKIFLGVIAQRRFNPIFQAFPQMCAHIGKIFSIDGKYVMNISHLDEGWRAKKVSSGGGALMDMGYHYVDLLIWYFGFPSSVTARITRGNREDQEYDVEDTVNVLFDYHLPHAYSEKTIGHFVISRVYHEKHESLVVYGTRGRIELQRGQICRYNNQGEEVERLTRKDGWPSAFLDQLNSFAKAIHEGKRYGLQCRHEHLRHIAIIEAAYESDRCSSSCNPADFLKQTENIRNI